MTIPASSYKITWRLTFAILFIMFAVPGTISSTSAQVGLSTLITIQGHITDERGNPIPGATLSVKWTERETSSDEHGSFRIENVTEKDTIEVSHTDYQSLQFPVEKAKTNYFITLKTAQKNTSGKSQPAAKGTLINISGKIYDDKGTALPDAILIVKGQNQGAFTNSKGEFSLSDVPTNAIVIISHVNFHSEEFIVEKSRSVYQLALRKKKIELDELVVEAIGPSDHGPNKYIQEQKNNGQFIIVERKPEFPGGKEALYKFLSAQVKYPLEASEFNISGKIFVTFIVNENGNIRNPQIVKGLGYGVDEEVLRVILTMPKWLPARQNGKAVRSEFALPIQFTLR